MEKKGESNSQLIFDDDIMTIDWKSVSKSEGYKSLKAEYVRDVQNAQNDIRKGRRPMRDKSEFRREFKAAIGLSMKYSNRWGIPIDKVLNHWEKTRTYWWLNFYQDLCVSRYKPNL